MLEIVKMIYFNAMLLNFHDFKYINIIMKYPSRVIKYHSDVNSILQNGCAVVFLTRSL